MELKDSYWFLTWIMIHAIYLTFDRKTYMFRVLTVFIEVLYILLCFKLLVDSVYGRFFYVNQNDRKFETQLYFYRKELPWIITFYVFPHLFFPLTRGAWGACSGIRWVQWLRGVRGGLSGVVSISEAGGWTLVITDDARLGPGRRERTVSWLIRGKGGLG